MGVRVQHWHAKFNYINPITGSVVPRIFARNHLGDMEITAHTSYLIPKE